jgi:cell division protease FtsH
MTLGKDGVTTGASNDIQRATSFARSMVAKWGLTDEMGPLLYEAEESDPYGQGPKPLSEETQRQIDLETRKIVDQCYKQAEQILEENRDILDTMCAALMKYETIDSSQIDELMERKPVSDPDGWIEDDHHKEPGAESEGSESDSSPEDDSTSEDDSASGDISETGGEGSGIDPDVPEAPDSSDKNIH